MGSNPTVSVIRTILYLRNSSVTISKVFCPHKTSLIKLKVGDLCLLASGSKMESNHGYDIGKRVLVAKWKEITC